jgi:type I restriction enzyme S subunit
VSRDTVPKSRLTEFGQPVRREVAIDPLGVYRTVGCHLYGKGVYERETKAGAEIKASRMFLIEKDDLVINRIWAQKGSAGIVPESLADAVVTQDFPVWVLNPNKAFPPFIGWYLKTPGFWEECRRHSHGTSGRERLSPKEMPNILFPLPPLDEQRRIVVRVEELAALIEEARGLRVKAREEAEALLASALREVFFGLDQDPNCEKTELGSIAELQRGRFSHRPRNDPRFFGGSHPWIQIGEIESAGKYVTNYTETLNDEGLAISRKFPKGTLLISIAATIGAIGILGFDCCVPDSIVAVMPDETKATSEFLYYFLAYTRSHLEEIAPQSAQKNINLRILRPLPFSLPPLEEQRCIVAYLDDLQAQIDDLITLQKSTQAELDALLPSVLDRAFRGEL